MNWVIGNPSNADSIASEDVNIVRFTNFGDSRLGVCYSWYTGCFSSGNLNWFVKELDIEFDSTRNWYYGTGSPTSNQLDFETVATHELGHGHQLGHVRASSKVMFYSLGPGQRKTDLVATDIEGGNYVKTKSIASSPCGPSNMQAVSASACLLSPPKSMFAISDTVICPGDNITITNNTETGDNSYAWDFGQGANPSYAATYGPHTVSFANSGTKTIRLISTNFIGSDTLEKVVVVKVNSLDAPNAFVQQDTNCLGNAIYQIEAVENAESYVWTTSSGGSISGANNEVSAIVNWAAGGNQTVSVKAANECTESSETQEGVFVVANPTAGFSYADNGTSLTFTNTSQNSDTHLWSFGDGNSSTAANPVHQYPDKGNYTVKLVSTNRCAEDSDSKQINVNFRASVIDVSKNIKVYPNPVKTGQLIVVEGEQFDTYTVYNMQGEVVINGKMLGNGFVIESVSSGAYIVHLQNNTHSGTRVPIQVIE
jgi:PKD repeat protein